jgi:nucleotide-binding universal stress UspA family protein
LSIATANQARVILLHVLEEMRALTSKNYRAELAKRVEPKLLALVPHAARKWCDVQIRVEAGTAYSEVLTIIKREKIDLVVMNTHGKRMLDRALLGSTSDRVARAAECPVMLVPPLKLAETNSHRPKRAA